ncbi:MAG: zinc metalloprotease HtpX, partial [Candidatus Aminicenantes bacterium]|nr:zinc metalloprotease HtpX [Candidatus Aminicenantes bacterium]
MRAEKKSDRPADFYSAQKIHRGKSLFLFAFLVLFYWLVLTLVTVFFASILAIFVPGLAKSFPHHLNEFLLIGLSLSLAIAVYHYYDARMFGAAFIKKRLGAFPPDQSDRYHKRYADTVEAIRLAAGLPEVRAYILPMYAVNSMALVEKDHTPAVLVTEGLLAEFSREEIEAVVAHELAHITRGDTVYITLVCSLSNMFERIRTSLQPERSLPGFDPPDRSDSVLLALYSALSVSKVITHLLSTLVSREREFLADAAAVEICRNPGALARAIYRAHIKNSFVGDFSLTYTPLFIVPPSSDTISDGWLSRLFNSHPPLMHRVKKLAAMIPVRPTKIIGDVIRLQKIRKEAREIVDGVREEPEKPMGGQEDTGEKIWSVYQKGGDWSTPLSIQELLFQDHFTIRIPVKNLQDGIRAAAYEFPEIRTAYSRMGRNKTRAAGGAGRCPSCRAGLKERYYEGVLLKACQKCGGRLVKDYMVERIIARREIGFSDELLEKAAVFKKSFMENPTWSLKTQKARPGPAVCPECGGKLLPRPFTYHYIVPVDKCFACRSIWFDRDELEILQILIEEKQDA